MTLLVRSSGQWKLRDRPASLKCPDCPAKSRAAVLSVDNSLGTDWTILRPPTVITVKPDPRGLRVSMALTMSSLHGSVGRPSYPAYSWISPPLVSFLFSVVSSTSPPVCSFIFMQASTILTPSSK